LCEEFFGVGGVSGKQGGDDTTALGGELVTMGGVHAQDQAVRFEDGEAPGDLCRLLASLLVIAALAEQVAAQVAVAEAIDQVVAVRNGTQQFAIGAGERVERACQAAAVLDHGLAQPFEQVAQGVGLGDAGETFGQTARRDSPRKRKRSKPDSVNRIRAPKRDRKDFMACPRGRRGLC
jgi:hypothetical protein